MQTLRGGDTSQQHASQPPRRPVVGPERRAGPRGSQPDYEKLGKLLFAIGETGTKSRSKLYRVAFFKGIWSGLGGAIGATIVVSILLWFFNILGSAPLIGPFVDLVQSSNDTSIKQPE